MAGFVRLAEADDVGRYMPDREFLKNEQQIFGEVLAEWLIGHAVDYDELAPTHFVVSLEEHGQCCIYAVSACTHSEVKDRTPNN